MKCPRSLKLWATYLEVEPFLVLLAPISKNSMNALAPSLKVDYI